MEFKMCPLKTSVAVFQLMYLMNRIFPSDDVIKTSYDFPPHALAIQFFKFVNVVVRSL